LDNKIVEKVKDSLRLNDKDFKVPAWLDLNKTNCSVKIISPPQVADIQTGVDVNLIIEYYSR